MSLPSSSVAMAELCGGADSPVSLDSSVFFGEMTASCVLRDPLDVFVVNVGGTRYVLSQQLLASYPDTRLGKLASCSRDSALELCDDADFLENEFFFDRNSQTFQYVMNFYRTGHLHVREELCEISFLQEIQYWGIDELRINACCRERYYRRKEQKETLDVRRDFEAEDPDEDFAGAACPALRRRLWDLLEKPESSRAARTFGSLSIFFVVLSVVNMVLISLDLDQDQDLGVAVAAPLLFDALEYVCVVWFTGELALRFLCVRDKWRFSRSIPNVIDLLAILPFYVTLAVENLHGGSTELENMGRVVQVLRLLRSLRMLKLGRHSTDLLKSFLSGLDQHLPRLIDMYEARKQRMTNLGHDIELQSLLESLDFEVTDPVEVPAVIKGVNVGLLITTEQNVEMRAQLKNIVDVAIILEEHIILWIFTDATRREETEKETENLLSEKPKLLQED
ncbi:uncharacterized protein V6R79_026134 [Siganus canaliculatus]